MIEKTCEVCGGAFQVKPYRADKARFCSRQCGGSWHARTRLNFGSKPWAVGNKWRAGKPPSNKGKPSPYVGELSPSWKRGIELSCEHCTKTFFQKPWLAQQNGIARFCSKSCFTASGCFVAEKSPTWVGGPQTYRGRGWLSARAVVVEEQRGCCANCHRYIGKGLPIHHRRPFREFATAEEANVRSNLVGLCQSCHMKLEPRPNGARFRPAKA